MNTRSLVRRLSWLILLALLAGCQTIPQHRLNQRVLERPELVTAPGKVVLLPVHVEIKEMSASGITEVVPGWTDTARQLIRERVLQRGGEWLKGCRLVPLPELEAEQAQRVREYDDLAKLVWADAVVMTRLGGPAWQHKIRHFDYSLGPGLKDLAERTGADRALLILGEDVHTTAGRKALSLGLAALGVAVPLGHSFLSAALIDLRTGDLLWVDTFTRADDTSFLDAEDVGKALQGLFANYPGIEAYRRYAQGG